MLIWIYYSTLNNFLCRVVDVTMGTIRVIFVSKGYRVGAALLGFFEIFI